MTAANSVDDNNMISDPFSEDASGYMPMQSFAVHQTSAE